jgi:hypothetical protein
MGGIRERSKHPVLDLLRPDTDSLDQAPREESPNEKLGLLARLDVGIAEVRRGNCRPVDLIELSKAASEWRVHGSRVGEAERPPTA